MMELTLLTVPACPNAAVFEERLSAALAGHPGAVVRRREVADEQEAAEAGMHGSPTLLVDGVDPFAAPGQPPSLSCRLYRDTAGRADGAPPVDALRRILEQRARLDPEQPGRSQTGRQSGRLRSSCRYAL
jgi:hypothetical protein